MWKTSRQSRSFRNRVGVETVRGGISGNRAAQVSQGLRDLESTVARTWVPSARTAVDEASKSEDSFSICGLPQYRQCQAIYIDQCVALPICRGQGGSLYVAGQLLNSARHQVAHLVLQSNWQLCRSQTSA